MLSLYALCQTNPACTRTVASLQEYQADPDLKLLVKGMFETAKWDLCVYERTVSIDILYQNEMGMHYELDGCAMMCTPFFTRLHL